MNREEFKNVLVNMIDYYTVNMINHSKALEDAEKQGCGIIYEMANKQAAELTDNFNFALESLLDKVYTKEEDGIDVSKVLREE
jgi:hypothetical protein